MCTRRSLSLFLLQPTISVGAKFRSIVVLAVVVQAQGKHLKAFLTLLGENAPLHASWYAGDDRELRDVLSQVSQQIKSGDKEIGRAHV